MIARVLYILLGAVPLLSWMGLELTAGAVHEAGTGWFLFAFLLSGLLFVVGTIIWLAFRRRPPLLGLSLGCLGLALALFAILPGGEGVVEKVITSDGRELMIAQSYDGEPYSVGFYFRRPGGDWGWFYYEHEDTRWLRSLSHIRLSPDQKQATLYRLFSPVAMFDLEKETFTIHRWQRTLPVQSRMPKGWTPATVSLKQGASSIAVIWNLATQCACVPPLNHQLLCPAATSAPESIPPPPP